MHRRLAALAAQLGPAGAAGAAAEAGPAGAPAAVEALPSLLFFPELTRADLPTATSDMVQAKRDIDIYGYAIWSDALTAAETRALALRIVAQAEAEVREGLVAGEDKDGTPKTVMSVSSVVNKGDEFAKLLTHPAATEMLTHLLGEHYNLSTGFAKMVMPGAVAETLHTDQWWCARTLLSSSPARAHW